ncbi:MAG TPA: ribonuclease P protein component [Xanthomonadales bacterium]|nr:ribonuclease P protein component [Xanthomonadales bacterium]
MSLPRRFRLSGQTAFSRVFKQAIVSSDGSFKVLARVSDGPLPRLGMAVSRQVDKRAVQRNRLKRVIRESFRAHYGNQERGVLADFVVLPRRQAASICNNLLFNQLERHWQSLDHRLADEVRTTQAEARR